MRISDWSSDVCSSDLIALDRATLGNWAGRAGFHLRPIAERMCWHLADAERLFMDETTAPVLAPGRGRTTRGYFWAVVSDDRGHGGTGPPIGPFRYAPGRRRVHSKPFLHGLPVLFL